MGVIFSNKYPYTDFHELNLDWLLEQMVKLDKAFDTFTSANTLTSADPIDWDISTQYGKNTIVVDPESGIAYLSVQPVPAGIEITDTDYWTPVFEFATLLQEYKDQMLAAYEQYKDELLAAIDNYIFYAPNYGIVPDSGEDLYEKIFYFLKDVVEPAGGGIVYFPKGEYKTSYTIFIPENTTFIGAGPATKFYFDETDTTAGVALSNGGSNVTIANMTVNSVNTGTIVTQGDLPGSIGISTIDFSQMSAPYSHQFVRKDMENIYVHNIYADSNYVLQTEPDSAHTIKNVTVDGVYAPESMVSMNPQGYGTIENIAYKNIVCDHFRMGSTTGHAIHAVADTIRCRTARFVHYPGGSYTYGTIEPYHVSNLDLNTTDSHSDMTNAVITNGPVDFVNCSIRNEEDTGAGLINRYNGALSFTNCKLYADYGTVFITSTGPTANDFCYTNLSNCNVTQIQTASATYIFGKAIGCVFRGIFRLVDPDNITRIFRGANTSILTTTQTLSKLFITVEKGIITLDITITIANQSDLKLFTLVNPYMRRSGLTAYAEIWNSSTPANKSLAEVSMDANGTMSYGSTHGGYNTAHISLTYAANENATITDLYNLAVNTQFNELRPA